MWRRGLFFGGGTLPTTRCRIQTKELYRGSCCCSCKHTHASPSLWRLPADAAPQLGADRSDEGAVSGNTCGNLSPVERRRSMWKGGDHCCLWRAAVGTCAEGRWRCDSSFVLIRFRDAAAPRRPPSYLPPPPAALCSSASSGENTNTLRALAVRGCDCSPDASSFCKCRHCRSFVPK